MQKILLSVIVGLFIFTLVLAWLFHGRGVIHNDTAKNIYIPEELTMPLQVKVAYNNEDIFFRYRWPASEPHIYHDMLVYQGGKWQRQGASQVGPQPKGIYEDRVTMLVDDGSVPEFSTYGGYLVIGDAMRFFTSEADKKSVKSHPYLGKEKHKKDVRKYLPETRKDPGDWTTVVGKEQLHAQRKAGYFLDLWHWRAHRSNPVGKSDDQYVAEYRYGDKGQGVYFTNWDKKLKQPKFMFDSAKTGHNALLWQDLLDKKLGFNDLYYLAEQQAVPFDNNHPWKDGDTIPRHILRQGSGSHADISVSGQGRWQEGYWNVTLSRAMDTGNPLDDKVFKPQRRYTLAFAVHQNATGSRWHYVSLPFSLGLQRDAEILAKPFSGPEPDWQQQEWTKIKLFYPGQVGWPFINSRAHAGAKAVSDSVPVKTRHSEEQLASYAVEMEFNDATKQQWGMTLFLGLILIACFGIAINLSINARRN